MIISGTFPGYYRVSEEWSLSKERWENIVDKGNSIIKGLKYKAWTGYIVCLCLQAIKLY